MYLAVTSASTSVESRDVLNTVTARTVEGTDYGNVDVIPKTISKSIEQTGCHRGHPVVVGCDLWHSDTDEKR